MINLLPESHKSEIRAARMNTLLLRYLAILSAAIIVLSGIVAAGYVVLEAKHESVQSLLQESQAKTAQYSSIRADAEAMQSSLSSAKSILDQKIPYTKLIYKIAASIPDGVVLDTLELDPSVFGSAMTINATAKTFEAASQLPNKLKSYRDTFTKVELLSLESGSSDEGATEGSAYPVRVSVSIVINKEALR